MGQYFWTKLLAKKISHSASGNMGSFKYTKTKGLQELKHTLNTILSAINILVKLLVVIVCSHSP